MDEPVDSLAHRLKSDDPAFCVPDIRYEIRNCYPHDPDAFTEGLAFHDGALYESAAGHEPRTISTLRQVEIGTGTILRLRALPQRYFAEGIAIMNGKIFQLTYLSNKGFVYDLETFTLLDTFCYNGDGWGLTDDGHFLIMSNGSNQLRFIDPNTLELSGGTIDVHIGEQPLGDLNELEYIGGYIYANVWLTDFVFRIDPKDGAVVGRLDLSALRPPETKDCDECVLNGIAYDEEYEHLFVTGKNWPKLYEIRLI
jgi:glutaminyl-peptide cyclotransferase